MSVDWTDCACCGDSMCDAGDNWNYCMKCGRHLCNDCLVKDYELDEDGYGMSSECCPYCSSTKVHNDDLLEFILKYCGLSREQAEELYKG